MIVLNEVLLVFSLGFVSPIFEMVTADDVDIGLCEANLLQRLRADVEDRAAAIQCREGAA